MISITIVQHGDNLSVVHTEDASKADIVSMLQQALTSAIVDLHKED
jgi:hypothetical protein